MAPAMAPAEAATKGFLLFLQLGTIGLKK